MDLHTMVGDIRLEHPIMNAAGPRCKTLEEIEQLTHTPVAAVMVGSITVEHRPGNQGEVYWSDPTDGFSLNSLGLPNGGLPYYRRSQRALHDMIALSHANGKPFFVSIAGFTPDEYGLLAGEVCWSHADLMEINLGCPNVWEGGKQKRIASFDPGLVEKILQAVGKAVTGHHTRVAVKVSPYSDPVLLDEVASVIATPWPLMTISAVTVCNTFPNGFAYREDGKSAISPQFSNGLAGMAGQAFKTIALGQVIQWRNLLLPSIDVIGVGGINSGQDVVDYLRAGATAVQIATAFADQGPKAFDRILTEFVSLKE